VNNAERLAAEEAERLGLLKPVQQLFREAPASADTEAVARGAEREERSQRVVRTGNDLVGSFKWRGGSGADPAAGWRINESTAWGHQNDFARYVNGTGPMPGPASTMNCWEAVLYTAHRAGAISDAELKGLHEEATEAARAAHRASGDVADGHTAYYKVIDRYLGPGERTRYDIDPATGLGGPDIPAGHVVFVDGIGHVMLSTGTRDAQGRQEVLSHWVFPQHTPAGPLTAQSYGVMQRTSVEEILSSAGEHLANARIESAAPTWLIEH
jgi:hypothetical protein